VSFQPTTEQRTALDLFATGRSLAIEAGAGAGKTSTLKLLAQSTDRPGQYIAFNKAIVVEAGEKMPGHVACNTAHSLAYRAVGKRYSARLRNSRRMRSDDIASRLGVTAMEITTQDGQRKNLSRTFLAGLAMRAVTRFCQSADSEPGDHHVPYVDGIDIPPGAKENNRRVRQHLRRAIRAAWADLQNPNGSLPYRHDHYLKQWQLSNPRIGANFILFDEAQDANPVMTAIVAAQRHAQLVWVGDSQQQIYSFTGAINALASVPADQRAYLTQSFRFGPAIAEVANRILGDLDADLALTGTDSIPSTVGPVEEPDVVLTRTNAEAVRTVLGARAAGRTVHLVGGGREIVAFAKGAQRLMDGERTDHPELACFDSWAEVQRYVAQDEQGGELRLMVKLVDEFTVPVIVDALDNMILEQAADLVVSTAHKAKGREWDAVQLAADFPPELEGEELRLLYVAVTRARRQLDVTRVAYFMEDAEEPQDAGEAEASTQAADAPAGPQADAGDATEAPEPELPVRVPATNLAYRPLKELADRYVTREAAWKRLRQIDQERERLDLERLLLVSLCDPEKQAHYEEEEVA
jgi:UvrD-like helicase C-terminal domain/AAA domain